MDCVSFSKDNQRVIAEEMEVTAPADRYDAPAKVLVSQKRSLEAAVILFHNARREALKSGRMNALYNNDCIYTPKVTVFRDDSTEKVLEEASWYEIDVVSCAAPNLRNIPGNAMNPDSGSKKADIQPADLLALHKKRISRVLDIAVANGAEVMILGAFGCGAFRNPPDIVAEAMSEVLGDYLKCFKVIEFAVYCQPMETRNYDVFKRVLSPVCGGNCKDM